MALKSMSSRVIRLTSRSPVANPDGMGMSGLKPCQLVSIPVETIGLSPRMVGVHSRVWILAISAETTSRAFWNRSSSERDGFAA